MNRRIKKRLSSICKTLLTLPVSSARCAKVLSGKSVSVLMPVGRSMSEVPVMIVKSTYMSTAVLVVKSPLRLKCGAETISLMRSQVRCILKEKAVQGQRATARVATAVVKVLGTFPCAEKPVQPAIFKELLSRNNSIENDLVTDRDSASAATEASIAHSGSNVVHFTRPSDVSHGLTVQLARDDLDSILTA